MEINQTGGYAPEENFAATDWNKQDTVWMLSLYGTAIGAGTLFLPIGAGMGGIIPMLLMLVLSFPLTYYAHRALCRFVLSSARANSDITEVVDEFFGPVAGKILTILYFFAIYPILLMYSVAITNTMESFMIHQLGVSPPPRAILSLVLIIGLMAVIRLGQQSIIKFMSMLVYPFVVILMLLALYLIPHWNMAIFTEALPREQGHSTLMTLWLIIPVLVFSFNHSPIISSFALHQKQQYGAQADVKSRQIMQYSHLMMVVTVMFFVFSCVFSLSPQDLAQAKAQNISILSYLANHFQTPLIAWIAPIIAFIAIAKSFLGHYLGGSEGLRGILAKMGNHDDNPWPASTLKWFIDGFMLLTCWIVATINPSILGMIETLGGPIIAMLLFIMPMVAIARIPAMRAYRSPMSDSFVVFIGLVAISAIVYGLR